MIEARVFYVGRGSSVVIRLGEEGCGKYGIIDCFGGHDKRDPLLQFLSREKVESIEFLVLTHPHDDHFLGVGRLLARYGGMLRRLYDWGVDPRQIVVGAFNSDSRTDRLARQDLDALRKFARSPSSRGRIYSISSPGLRLYEDKERSILVQAVAPCGDCYRRIQESLVRYFRKCKQYVEGQGDTLPNRLPRPSGIMDLNLLSSAIEISVAGKSILFGGDVLRGTWNTLLRNGGHHPADVVLLSHHGSHTGFPTSFWGSRFGRGDGLAIVSGEGLHQPSSSVAERIRISGATLYATSADRTQKRASSLGHYVTRFHHGTGPDRSRRQDLVVRIEMDETTVTESSLGF